MVRNGRFAFLPYWIAVVSLVASTSGAQDVYLNQEADALRFGNASVELTLDAKSGFFRQITNKSTKIQHKNSEDGVWPFGLTVGTRNKPEQMRAEIRADGVQRMRHEVVDTTSGGKRLTLIYPMLVDNITSQPTGVGLGVNILLLPQRDYFSIRTEIANGGPNWITNFYAGHGEVLTGDETRTDESVAVPARGIAKYDTFSLTAMGLPTYAWGWSDYSGARGGLGIAYVNQQGIQWMFDWKKTAHGLMQGWHLFDTRGYWHFESMMNDYQKSMLIQPLEPANNFTTDEWLIIPHAGDWHRTADVYRERYQEVFKNDYMDWEHLPASVRNLYLHTGGFVAENSIGNTYPRGVNNSLEVIPKLIDEIIQETGAPAERVGVNFAFFHPNVGRYPEWFPIYGPAGGEEGWRQAISHLRQLGIGYIMGYTHLSYNHPAAKNYVIEADTRGTVPVANPTAGERACMNSTAWIRLWKDDLVPAYKAHGMNAVYSDEGFFPWGTCAAMNPEHLHGPTAVGILTGNTNGTLRFDKILHEGLGADSVVMTEGAGDVSGRWKDANHAYDDPTVPYTLPFKRYYYFTEPTSAHGSNLDVNKALSYGYVLGFNFQQNQPKESFKQLRRYVETRQRLDKDHAPGYPQGYRDNVGVKTSDANLVAKSFSGTEGITVVYYATAPATGKISVDGAALGHSSVGIREQEVTLDKDALDYLIIR